MNNIMKPKLFFGTAGIPHSTQNPTTTGGIQRIKELKLDAMELEFVHKIYLNQKTAEETGKANEKNKVILSAHAPYYINLNSEKKEIIQASRQRILQSAKMCFLAGGKATIIHAGYYLNKPKKIVFETIKQALEETMQEMKKEKIETKICLETTGKQSQFGTLEEIMQLSSEIEGIFPCIDFSHLHARSNGAMKTKKEFEKTLEAINSFGKKYLTELNVHASGIEYTAKGEKKHLMLESKENDFNYKAMTEALMENHVTAIIICESPNPETDALLMKGYYEKLLEEA